jgi:AcrR family transcriptional regulator
MPKKFNEQEKQWIRRKLLEEGKRLFESHGLRKTKVEELTKAAGISQGAFYLFFGSKEELFYELLLAEEARIREQLLQMFGGEREASKESLRRFVSESFRLLSENALIRTMHLQGEFEQLIRKLPPEKLEQNFAQDRDAMLHVVRKWQEAGILREERPELIVSLFRSIVLLALHRKEIGEDIYPQTIELLVRVLVDGLYKSRLKERERHDSSETIGVRLSGSGRTDA